VSKCICSKRMFVRFVCVCVGVLVRVCVCVRERERERESVCGACVADTIRCQL
jgi:hypothetical protein